MGKVIESIIALIASLVIIIPCILIIFLSWLKDEYERKNK